MKANVPKPGNHENKFFTKDEIYIMMDHGVPELTAYTRIKQLKWDRHLALTSPLKTKGSAKRQPEPQRVFAISELNWKE